MTVFDMLQRAYDARMPEDNPEEDEDLREFSEGLKLERMLEASER